MRPFRAVWHLPGLWRAMSSTTALHGVQGRKETYSISGGQVVLQVCSGIFALACTAFLVVLAEGGGVVFFIAIPLCGLGGILALVSVPAKANEKLVVDRSVGFEVHGCTADNKGSYQWDEVDQIGRNLPYKDMKQGGKEVKCFVANGRKKTE